MTRFAIAYDVCSVCVDHDADISYTKDAFYKRVRKCLAECGFDVMLQESVYTCVNGTENSMDDVDKFLCCLDEKFGDDIRHITKLDCLKIINEGSLLDKI